MVTAAQPEKALPTLQLTESRKSATSVAEISSSFQPSQVVVREFGDLTFILSPGNRLHLVDELGREVPGFNLINDLTIVNWDNIRAGVGTDPSGRRRTVEPNQYSTLAVGSGSFAMKAISDCPPSLQPFLKAYYTKTRDQSRYVVIPRSNWQLGEANQPHEVVIGKDFVLFHDFDDNQNFIAYVTVDSQGQAMNPANWKRFDTTNEYLGDIPASIKEQIDKLRGNHANGIQSVKTTQGFNIVAQINRISIVEADKPLAEAKFNTNIPLVGDNICIDPQDPKVVYYCSTGNATEIFKLRLEGDPSTWRAEAIPIKKAYPQIYSLQLDPSGTAFMFETGSEVVIVDKNSFQEIKKLPLKKAVFDSEGKIRGLDRSGSLVVYEHNLQDISTALERRQFAQMAAGIDVHALFQTPAQAAVEVAEPKVNVEALSPIRDEYEANFLRDLTRVENLQEVTESLKRLQTLRDQFAAKGFNPDQVSFITQGIAEAINLRQQVFAQHEAGKMLEILVPRISPDFVSIATMPDLRAQLDHLNSLTGLLPQETRNQVSTLTQRFNQQVGELYRREGAQIRSDIAGRISGIRATLEQMTTRAAFNDWRELDLPKLQQNLIAVGRESPLEAVEVQKAVNEAREQLGQIVRSYEDKFRKEYNKVREDAQGVTAKRGALIASETDGYVSRMLEREFASREDAEQVIASSGTRLLLENDIADLEKSDPERAKILARDLKIKIANLYGEIERKSKVRRTGHGDEVPFGEDTFFPKWAAKTTEAPTKKTVDLVYIVPPDVLRNGTDPNKILGDIGVKVITSTGVPTTVRLFEGQPSKKHPSESDWLAGLVRKGGLEVPSTRMSKDSFLRLRNDFNDWNQPNSRLKAEYIDLRKQVLTHLQKRPRLSQRPADYQDDPTWRAELDTLNQKYAQFVVDHHIMFLDRIDQIQRAPMPEAINGKGLVAKWDTSWTRDEYTEEKLVEIVKLMKMQIEQDMGLILFEGPPGTGKDVCVDMLSALLERPKFTYNCSNWTTEEDLTEVLLLTAREGAPESIKVPSSVLTGMQTPGAIVYFNEFSTLPPPAQVFLNSMADHKRILSLKTSGGKIVRADPSVLFFGSANLGSSFEGTFNIQLSAGDRMTLVHFDYIPLFGKNREGDTNPNPPYSSSGALRIARGVKSLQDLAIESNLKRNEFVKIWDQYINHVDRGVDLNKLTPIQKYDLEVILCIVQWGDKLNIAFAKQASNQASANDLPVTIPFTGRSMWKMAYWLGNEIPDKEKEEGLVPGRETYEKTARSLFEKFFLDHITDAAQKDAIRNYLQGLSSQKRL